MPRRFCAEWYEDRDDFYYNYVTQPRIVERSTEEYWEQGWEPPKVIECGPLYECPSPEEIKEMEEWMEKKIKQYNAIVLQEKPCQT